MTTIVACTLDGAVFMGSDSLTNVYERPVTAGARKVLRMDVSGENDQALVGVCGDMGVLTLLQYHITALPGLPVDRPYASPAERLDTWAYGVARAVTTEAVEAGSVEEGRMAATLLLGYRGMLWTIVHANVVRHADGRASLGSGEGPAIGALDVLLDRGFGPQHAIHDALLVAAHRDKHTAGPFILEQLDPPAVVPDGQPG